MAAFMWKIFLLIVVAFLSIVDSSKYYAKYFEVDRPVSKPAGARRCSIPVMKNHVFGNTSFTANFLPPTGCGTDWSLVTLSWSAYLETSGFASTGNVFIDGLNVLKTFADSYSVWLYFDGTVGTWSFEIDITKYKAFLKQKRVLTVTFLNSGSYLKANLTLNYYSGTSSLSYADTVVPLSPKSTPRSPFQLTFASKKGQVSVSGLPRNIYRAEVEIFQIHGGSDHRYWNNFPDKFIKSLPPSERIYYTGGGAFKETLLYVDGLLAGAVWQFPLAHYSNLIAWNPVRAIGSFSAPSYKIDITPFVGKLVDGKSHTFTFALVSPSNGSLWEVSGALHLWLDKKSKQTSGKLISRQIDDVLVPSVTFTYKSNISFFSATNTTTKVQRKSSIVGYVATSFGNFTATSTSSFSFLNDYRTTFVSSSFLPLAPIQTTTQTLKGSVLVDLKFKNGSRVYRSSKTVSFPLVQVQYYDGYESNESISHGYIHNISTLYGRGKELVETLSNTQTGKLSGYYHSDDVGEYGQRYSYRSNFQGCYYRKINVSQGLFKLNQGRSIC